MKKVWCHSHITSPDAKQINLIEKKNKKNSKIINSTLKTLYCALF